MSSPKRAPTPLHAPRPRFRCECEHEDHFDGGPKHPYGCGLEVVEPIHTIYGTFNICPACRATCGYEAYVPESVEHQAERHSDEEGRDGRYEDRAFPGVTEYDVWGL